MKNQIRKLNDLVYFLLQKVYPSFFIYNLNKMYCRKCKRANKKKINMEVKTEQKCYVCPICAHIVKWNIEDTLAEELIR